MASEAGSAALGEVVALQRGTTYKSALLDRPGPVLLGLASINRNGGFRSDSLRTYGGESPDKLLLRPGDLYVSLKDVTQSGDLLGSVSRVPISVEMGRLTQDTLKLTIGDPRFAASYLYWALRTPGYRHYCRAHAIGTTNLSLSREDFLAFKVPIPGPAELRLVELLEALDDRIELSRLMSETLEAIARAPFKSWFVDFDPVRAKSEGRDPGLPRHYADLFPDSWEDSDLGEIPRGWRVRVLFDVIAELETGGRPKGGVSGYTTGIPSIGAESIVGLGVFDYSKTKYVPHEFFAGMSRGHIQSRDVLLYKDGGRPGEFEPHVTLFGDGFPYGACAINEHVYRLRATDDLGQNFLLFWLSCDLVMEEMRIKGTGVAIPGLNSTQVKSLTTLVPPREVVQAFDVLAEPWVARVLATCNESRTLTVMRDALLPMLISGRTRPPALQPSTSLRR